MKLCSCIDHIFSLSQSIGWKSSLYDQSSGIAIYGTCSVSTTFQLDWPNNWWARSQSTEISKDMLRCLSKVQCVHKMHLNREFPKTLFYGEENRIISCWSEAMLSTFYRKKRTFALDWSLHKWSHQLKLLYTAAIQ